MSNITYYKRKYHGICTACGEKNDSPWRVICKDCREIRYEKDKQLIRDRIAKGLCTRCGCYNITPLFRRCPECRQKIK